MSDTRMAYRNPEPAFHADFPDLTVAPNGDLLLVVRRCGRWARDATFAYGRPLTFFEAEAELLLLRSADSGETFAEQSVLFTGLAYDPVIATLPDGRILAGAVVGEAGPRQRRAQMQGVLHRHIPQLDTVITVRGAGLWVSTDEGGTWPDDPRVAAVEGWENVYNLRKPFALHDGTLILPVAMGYPWRTRCVGIIRSWDGGRTWSDASYVAEDPAGRAHYAAGVGYWQPSIVPVPSGDLVCICVLDDHSAAPPRRAGGDTQRGFGPAESLPSLVRTHSADSGFTWSVPEPTGLEGDFPSLIALADGRLALTCAQRHTSASRVVAYISDDEGVTWEPAGTLRESTGEAFYYTNTVQLPDGNLLTAYMTSQPDLVRVVETTHWTLP